MRRLIRSSYPWLVVAVLAVVGYAYTAREHYRQAAVLAAAEAPDFTFPSPVNRALIRRLLDS